ncbi:MAG: branched-chain amino acid aminotransferase [Candidatus Margulisiibacteriota bacterium]
MDLRLDDLFGESLRPSLHPNAFEQTFVEGLVLERADRIINDTPQVKNRIMSGQVAPIGWDKLTFSFQATDAMFLAMTRSGDAWPQAELVPFEEFQVSPAAGALNYGQGLFEGMKAYRSGKNRVVLFRPEDNARRAIDGAKRLGLTPVPQDYFLDAVTRVVRANERWIPPQGKGALYIRPLLIGSGPILGVSPAPENTFIVYVSPVGPYFKGGLTAIPLMVSEDNHRAAPGGTGNVKAIGNYAPGMIPAKQAKGAGFAEVIYLDAKSHRNVEEVGAANFFYIDQQGVIHTPGLTGTILPGITRNSVIQLARDFGYQVEEGRVPIAEVMANGVEAFCTGTAAVISPIGSITHGGQKAVFGNNSVGQVTSNLYEALTAIQEERAPDPYGWVRVI